MPTQRPFFANFFSAFRARSTPGPFQAKSSTTTGAITSTSLTTTAHISTTPSAPRNITSKQIHEPTPQKNTFATAISTSPGTTFYRRPPSPSPSHHLKSPGHTTPTQMTRGRQRRDSGSSHTSNGFIDVMGTEKWYVGGRTAQGEERFYQLGLVNSGQNQRVRSLDRLSL